MWFLLRVFWCSRLDPVPNVSRVSAVARWTSETYGELRGSSAEMGSAVSRQPIVSAYGKLPLSFEANRGRTKMQNRDKESSP